MITPRRIYRGLRSRFARLTRRRPATVAGAVRMVRRSGRLEEWLLLLQVLEPRLDSDSRELLRNHEFMSRSSAIQHFMDDLNNALTASGMHRSLTAASALVIAPAVIQLIVKHKTVLQCRDAHTEGGYYADAEKSIDWQWQTLIEPFIRSFDLSRTLELAPGHGRNSQMLARTAKELYLVDVNATCIEACRKRFGDRCGDCRFHYLVNDGASLAGIADNTATFVYSFDSMVHFDKLVVRDYLAEFKRVLVPRGTGFIHHSNYGAIRPNSDWATNPGNRSDTSAKIVREFCSSIGLEVLDQRLHGIAEGRGLEALDCVTIFRRP